jgi:glutathione S-transferase
MTIQFYMTPGSCSTGIHILLEELELPFQVTIVNLPAGDHLKPEYVALNPKGTIPTLVTDAGQALTEFQAIAYWLARSYPRKRLLPEDPLLATRALELMDYVVGTVHGQAYTRIFTTERYLPPGLADAERSTWLAAIQTRGREMVSEAFAVIETRLPEAGYALGSDFTIADAALFYVEFWADKTGLSLPPRCAAHYQLVRARPVVQQVLREEGYR